MRRPKGERQALNVEQISAIRDAASRWRTGPDIKGPEPDGQVRDIIEVLLGTALRIGECLALRVCDVDDGSSGMTISVTGTVVLRTGSGAVRQDHPKTEHSIRRIAVPDFAAAVLRARLAGIPTSDSQRTIFANRAGKPPAAWRATDWPRPPLRSAVRRRRCELLEQGQSRGEAAVPRRRAEPAL